MTLKKESLLYIALAIPVLMILITILGIFFFQVKLKPQYNFIYAQLKGPGDGNCKVQIEEKLHPKHHAPKTQLSEMIAKEDCSSVAIYLYDFKTEASTKLTLNEAQHFVLSAQYPQTSPDGFIVQPYCNSDSQLGIGWWNVGNGGYGVCLRKDNYQQRLSLEGGHKLEGLFHRFVFLGWVLGEKQSQKKGS